MDDAKPVGRRSLLDHRLHDSGDRNIQIIRIPDAQTDGEAALGISIHQQDTLPGPGQADAQIDRCDGLAHAALLVGNGDYFAWVHTVPPFPKVIARQA